MARTDPTSNPPRPDSAPVSFTGSADPSLQDVQRALAGGPDDREVLLPVFARVPDVVRVLLARRGIRLQAEDLDDLVQDCLELVWRKLPEFEGRSRLLTWVWRLCDLELRNSVRRLQKLRRTKSLSAPGDGEGTPSEDPQAPEGKSPQASLSLDLEMGLGRLPPDQRRVVELRHFEGRSFEEIAATSDTNVHRIRSLYQRAMRRLFEFFQSRELEG